MGTENPPGSCPWLSEGSLKKMQTESLHLPLAGQTGSRGLEIVGQIRSGFGAGAMSFLKFPILIQNKVLVWIFSGLHTYSSVSLFQLFPENEKPDVLYAFTGATVIITTFSFKNEPAKAKDETYNEWRCELQFIPQAQTLDFHSIAHSINTSHPFLWWVFIKLKSREGRSAGLRVQREWEGRRFGGRTLPEWGSARTKAETAKRQFLEAILKLTSNFPTFTALTWMRKSGWKALSLLRGKPEDHFLAMATEDRCFVHCCAVCFVAASPLQLRPPPSLPPLCLRHPGWNIQGVWTHFKHSGASEQEPMFYTRQIA